MLVILIRTAIIYICLFIILRLMGKRQLAQLQPFEFVITLILADLACVPMAEISIPISYGLIPIFCVFILHIIITVLSVKNIQIRKLVNGTPQIIINNGSLCFTNIKKLGLHINDILEGLRAKGYFSPLEVQFAIVETGGGISVMPKGATRPVNPNDLNISVSEASLTTTIIAEGRLSEANINNLGTSKEKVYDLLKKLRVKKEEIFLLTIDLNKNVYLQLYNKPYKSFKSEDI